MNICYVHTADFTEHKGSSIHVKEVVKYLSVVHTVTLLVDKWDGPRLEGVHIVEMKCPRPFTFIWRVLFSLLYLTHILFSEDIDLLYAKSPLEGSIAISVGKFFRIPLIYEVNGLIVEESKMKGESRLHILVSSILEWFVITYAAHFICVTEWIKENLISRSIPETKATVIENGADPTLFQPMKDAKSILNLDPEKNYIGFIGTLKAWQGLDSMLDAVPFITEKSPETEVLIVGEGELMGWLQKCLKERNLKSVIITGKVKHEEVPLYISACDICLTLKKPLSSGYSPLKLYEYMACEKPVVASRVKGFECLEKENAGILVDQKNPAEVADAVVKLLKDENLQEAMGKRGRKFVLKSHTWEKIAQEISDVCIKVSTNR